MPKRSDNSHNGASREAWMKDKVIGRLKQKWVGGETVATGGHWEKIRPV
jgi:hypothetical protein